MGKSQPTYSDTIIMSEHVITMYESRWCGYCRAAKRLLESKGWSYNSIVVDGEPELRAEMESKSGGHTVPQIFIGDHHVGGYDDMAALDRKGELDDLVSQAG